MGKAETKFANTAKKMDAALLTLLEHEEFADITVTDICKAAGVNRSTFYAHYHNTVDLLDEVRKGALNGFFESFGHLPTDEGFLNEGYIDAYLSFVEENRLIFSTLISNSEIIAPGLLFEEIEQPFAKGVFGHDSHSKKSVRYKLRFIAAGITCIVVTWLEGGCKEGRCEIRNVILECVEGFRTSTNARDRELPLP